jgi:hypothetical protein
MSGPHYQRLIVSGKLALDVNSLKKEIVAHNIRIRQGNVMVSKLILIWKPSGVKFSYTREACES